MWSPEPPRPQAAATPGAVPRSISRGISRGISLVELMLGMVAGLLVVLGGLTLLASTQSTSVTANDAARLQLKADSILRTMGFQIMQGGAVELHENSPGTVVFSSEYTGYDPAVVASVGVDFLHVHGIEAGGANGSDVLRVSYEDDGAVRDCLGGRTLFPALSGTSRVDSQFWLIETTLVCRGSSAAQEQVIADGVEDLQVTYTVRGGAAGLSTFRTYRASAVPAAQWRDVTAVHVCLRIISAAANVPGQGTVVGCRGENVAPDGRIRRVVTRTFAIRNVGT